MQFVANPRLQTVHRVWRSGTRCDRVGSLFRSAAPMLREMLVPVMNYDLTQNETPMHRSYFDTHEGTANQYDLCLDRSREDLPGYPAARVRA